MADHKTLVMQHYNKINICDIDRTHTTLFLQKCCNTTFIDIRFRKICTIHVHFCIIQ